MLPTLTLPLNRKMRREEVKAVSAGGEPNKSVVVAQCEEKNHNSQ